MGGDGAIRPSTGKPEGAVAALPGAATSPPSMLDSTLASAPPWAPMRVPSAKLGGGRCVSSGAGEEASDTTGSRRSRGAEAMAQDRRFKAAKTGLPAMA